MITNLSIAMPRYDQADDKKFSETNQCAGCNLSNDSFSDHRNANLEHANLSSARFYGDYTKANYSYANGINAAFSNGSEAKFNNAILINAGFSGNFTYADFTGANLTDADLANTNLFGAKITDQQLKEARTVCNAILPDGTKGACK